MMISGKRFKKQRGDTIVEVLICVLIVSLVLTGAYVTTQRSSVGIRNSQEHAEALKLIQSQIEQLRANAAQSTASVFTTNAQPFCMVNNAPLAAKQGPGLAQCIQNASGAQAGDGQVGYELTISRVTNSRGTLFTVRADWNAVTGTRAYESIFYRLHQ